MRESSISMKTHSMQNPRDNYDRVKTRIFVSLRRRRCRVVTIVVVSVVAVVIITFMMNAYKNWKRGWYSFLVKLFSLFSRGCLRISSCWIENIFFKNPILIDCKCKLGQVTNDFHDKNVILPHLQWLSNNKCKNIVSFFTSRDIEYQCFECHEYSKNLQ